MKVEIKKLSVEIINDFYKIHSGDTDGWCCCVSWWVESWKEWGERTEEQNRKLRDMLFAKGEYDGYILYCDNEPAGWCQCGKRDRLIKLTNQFKLQPSADTWAVTCFLIKPEFRKKGLSRKFLELVLEDLKASGVKHVQAFPRSQPAGKELDDGEVWTGPENIYINSGFVKESGIESAPVYSLYLNN
ncbi:MAG: GNAT family N-acetyltransferase [Chlorobi bacterium]|nr:GNAT family N-acetyltransferase [Chlorobiota bacterium]MCI0715864.1 GNAT family N-acetyltransferase [Chlorobiota bacterium]